MISELQLLAGSCMPLAGPLGCIVLRQPEHPLRFVAWLCAALAVFFVAIVCHARHRTRGY